MYAVQSKRETHRNESQTAKQVETNMGTGLLIGFMGISGFRPGLLVVTGSMGRRNGQMHLGLRVWERKGYWQLLFVGVVYRGCCTYSFVQSLLAASKTTGGPNAEASAKFEFKGLGFRVPGVFCDIKICINDDEPSVAMCLKLCHPSRHHKNKTCSHLPWTPP